MTRDMLRDAARELLRTGHQNERATLRDALAEVDRAAGGERVHEDDLDDLSTAYRALERVATPYAAVVTGDEDHDRQVQEAFVALTTAGELVDSVLGFASNGHEEGRIVGALTPHVDQITHEHPGVTVIRLRGGGAIGIDTAGSDETRIVVYEDADEWGSVGGLSQTVIHHAPTPEPTTTRAEVARVVAQMKREILDDVLAGHVPTSCATFAELHDHRDANLYGPSDLLLRRVDLHNAAMDEVNAWIRGGALRNV